MDLYINATVSGLISVLTPGVFLFLVTTAFLFERLESSSRQGKINVVLFSIFTVIIYVFVISEVIKTDSLTNNSSYILLLDYFLIAFLLWVLSSFFPKYQLIHTERWKQFFRFLGLLVLSCKLVLVSLSSAGPILGVILISNVAVEDLPNIYGSLLGFSVGLVIPFIIVLWLVSKKHNTLRGKKWWRTSQQITVGILLLYSLIQFMKPL